MPSTVAYVLLACAACLGSGLAGCARAEKPPVATPDVALGSPQALAPPAPPAQAIATPAEAPDATPAPPAESASPEKDTRAQVYALLARLWKSHNLTDRDAVREIGALGAAAVPHLLEALDSRAEGLAGTAAFVLAETHVDPTLYVPHIRDVLAQYLWEATSPRAAYREHGHTIGTCVAILRTLGPAGGPAVPQIAALMDTPDEELRMYCLLVFQNVGPPAAIALPTIRKELISRTAPLRRHALRAISRIGPSAAEALPDLERMLFTPNATEHRWEVFEALCGLGTAAAPALPTLRRAVSDPAADLAVGAATALALLEPSGDRIPTRVTDALASEASATRLAGVRGLKMLGARCTGSVGPLIARLSDADAQIRQVAAESLGNLGPAAAAALPALRQLASDPHELVRNVASWATDRIAGR